MSAQDRAKLAAKTFLDEFAEDHDTVVAVVVFVTRTDTGLRSCLQCVRDDSVEFLPALRKADVAMDNLVAHYTADS